MSGPASFGAAARSDTGRGGDVLEPGTDPSDRPWDDQFETMVRRSLPSLPDERPLLAGDELRALGLTSMMIVMLVLEIEGHYGVEFGDDLLLTEVCATPGTLWSTLITLPGTRSDQSDLSPPQAGINRQNHY